LRKVTSCQDVGMRAHSKDLRLRMLAAVDRGMPRREVAETFGGVSTSTVKRYLRLRRQSGGMEAKPRSPVLQQPNGRRWRRDCLPPGVAPIPTSP
jgi:transposase-like protein